MNKLQVTLMSALLLLAGAVHAQVVKVEEAKHALVSIDGRLIGTPVGTYHINVEQEVVNFLIPD